MARTVDGRMKFDDCCRAIMMEFLQFFLEAVKKRKSRSASYKFDVYQFLCSDQLDNITEHYLPVTQATVQPCCFIMVMSLDRLLSTFVTEALHDLMRSRFPALFKKEDGEYLTPAEINSEVNRFLGWAILSAIGSSTAQIR